MPERVGRQGRAFRVDEVDRVLRAVPGAQEAGARKDAPGDLAAYRMVRRVVQTDVALLRKAVADHEMAGIVLRLGAEEQGVGDGDDGRDARRDPVLQLADVREARDVGADAGKGAGKGGIEGPV